MKYPGFAIAFAVVLTLLIPCASADTSREKLAQQAAETWIGLIDSEQYPASWEQSAELFRAAITQDKWVATISHGRGLLGKLRSRTFKSATYLTSVPGGPDGHYVVLQYATVYEHKQAAVETITPMLDKDGKWRVAGYYIK